MPDKKKATMFPRDCPRDCPHFRSWDMSIDDWTCECDLMDLRIDECDMDFRKARCPLDDASDLLSVICDDYGLTPLGIKFALAQYQKVICEITHGILSKLTYEADHVLEIAQERWCETCDLKREPAKPETYLVMGTFKFYRCPECKMSLYTKGNYCPNCGREMIWDGIQ